MPLTNISTQNGKHHSYHIRSINIHCLTDSQLILPTTRIAEIAYGLNYFGTKCDYEHTHTEKNTIWH